MQAQLEEANSLVAQTKEAASLELSMQRHEYEDKLAELEKALVSQLQCKLQSLRSAMSSKKEEIANKYCWEGGGRHRTSSVTRHCFLFILVCVCSR